MKLQNDKLMALQSDIDRSEQKINDQRIISENQANIIYTISVSLAMAIILGSVLLFYLRENRKINKKLASQNAEILDQRNQLIELSKQAKDATDAKINFFTNISHEFRTPLTAILGYAEIARRRELDESERIKHVITIESSAIHMLQRPSVSSARGRS